MVVGQEREKGRELTGRTAQKFGDGEASEEGYTGIFCDHVAEVED